MAEFQRMTDFQRMAQLDAARLARLLERSRRMNQSNNPLPEIHQRMLSELTQMITINPAVPNPRENQHRPYHNIVMTVQIPGNHMGMPQPEFAQLMNETQHFFENISMGHRPNVSPIPSRVEPAFLKFVIFEEKEDMDQDQKICGICYENFKNKEHITQTSCCGTKFMHLQCSVNVLRGSKQCPFCKYGEIQFNKG